VGLVWWEEGEESPIWGWAEKAWSQAWTSTLLNHTSLAADTASSSEAKGEFNAISFANLVLPQHARKSFSSNPNSIAFDSACVCKKGGVDRRERFTILWLDSVGEQWYPERFESSPQPIIKNKNKKQRLVDKLFKVLKKY
jgi:hypothetical protein